MTAANETVAGARVLVIGIGNELRRDDGVGPAIGREIEKLALPRVRSMVVHQLTPELAEDLAAVETAIFVDAAVAETVHDLMIYRIHPAFARAAHAHTGDPASLLDFARLNYGRAPDSWIVGVPAFDMGHGEGLSENTTRFAADAVEVILEISSRHA